MDELSVLCLEFGQPLQEIMYTYHKEAEAVNALLILMGFFVSTQLYMVPTFEYFS